LAHNNLLKICISEITNLKLFGERGTSPSHSGIEVGLLLTAHACLDSTAYTDLDPLAVFEQFEHWAFWYLVLSVTTLNKLLAHLFLSLSSIVGSFKGDDVLSLRRLLRVWHKVMAALAVAFFLTKFCA